MSVLTLENDVKKIDMLLADFHLFSSYSGITNKQRALVALLIASCLSWLQYF
jgi:hypothetical protein